MILAIGGHSRGVGKTSILCSLLRATPEISWTAVKISSNRRGRATGVEVHDEAAPRLDRDSGRYLSAGARRAIWMRARDTEMAEAAAALRAIASQSDHVIVESNRIVERWSVDLYVLALDCSVNDFKDSAHRLFRRADAYVLSRPGEHPPNWPRGLIGELWRKPTYGIDPPDYAAAGLIGDVRKRLMLVGSRTAA